MRSVYWHTDFQSQYFIAQRLLAIFFVAIALVFCTQNTTIAMESCSAITPTPSTKFVIDRFIVAGLADAEQTKAEAFAYGAASTFASNLSTLLSVARVVNIANCYPRSPNIDASDFASDKVKDMDSRHVLFEVWGHLAAHQKKEKLTAAEGVLVYFMIPIPDSPWPLPARIGRDYQYQGDSLKTLFEKIFLRGNHLEVLAAVAYGVAESRNHRYDAAQSAFCRALVVVQQNSKDVVWSDLNLDARQLATAIENLAENNLTKARSDLTYRGPFKNAIPATDGTACSH